MLNIRLTGEYQCVSGLGGRARSEIGELTLSRSDGLVVITNTHVVDEILTTKKQDKESLNRSQNFGSAEYSAK